LSIEDGTDPQIGLAVDWERSAKGIMSYPALRRFVALFSERMKSVKKAVAVDRLLYMHNTRNISRAIRDLLRRKPDAGYWGCRLAEAKSNVGDIVCWAKPAGIDYDHQKGGDYQGHCDLVVAVDDRQVDMVGGNVGNSVIKRPLRLSEGGVLQETVQGGEKLFAIVQNRIVHPSTTAPIASVRKFPDLASG